MHTRKTAPSRQCCESSMIFTKEDTQKISNSQASASSFMEGDIESSSSWRPEPSYASSSTMRKQ